MYSTCMYCMYVQVHVAMKKKDCGNPSTLVQAWDLEIHVYVKSIFTINSVVFFVMGLISLLKLCQNYFIHVISDHLIVTCSSEQLYTLYVAA